MTEDLSLNCPVCSAALGGNGENYECGQDPTHFRIRKVDHIKAWHEFNKDPSKPDAETSLYEAINAGNIAEKKIMINTELPKDE